MRRVTAAAVRAADADNGMPRTGSTLLAHFSAWRAAVSEGGSAYSLNSGGGTTAPGYASGLSAMAQLPS